MSDTTSLREFNNREYSPGPTVKRLCWYFISIIFFRNGLFPFYNVKRGLLRLFNARIGRGVIIKPYVNIKYPWFLEIGDYSWIGENVWIDNLITVRIGRNCCLSQGAFLLTGNHDFSKVAFDLITRSIILEEGVWIGAKAIVCPGIVCYSHSVLSVGSIATKDLESYSIYQGNPAMKVKERNIAT